MDETIKQGILGMVRTVGVEFSNVADDVVSNWIEISSTLVGQKVFGDKYKAAMAYLICHKMKMLGLGSNEAGAITDMLNVASYNEGDTSISFGTNQSNNMQADAEYTYTSYGLQFLTLKQSCVLPVLISGMQR